MRRLYMNMAGDEAHESFDCSDLYPYRHYAYEPGEDNSFRCDLCGMSYDAEMWVCAFGTVACSACIAQRSAA